MVSLCVLHPVTPYSTLLLDFDEIDPVPRSADATTKNKESVSEYVIHCLFFKKYKANLAKI